jgi:general secretion pathway protein A
MYYQHFGLNKNPFSMTPDPSSLYLTNAHREAIAGLSYGALSRKGFVVLTGEAGTGKTTLLRRLVELSKESSARCSVVFNPLLTPAEFLELLLFNFGMRDMPASKTQRLLKLEELLLETHRNRKTAVLIVDEAHKLSHEVFEEIRLLTNFETGEDKLLQIVLAGQPELKAVLNHPDLWQLKQRIAVRLHVDPLAARQVGAFITYRWTRFGGAEPHAFTPEAVGLIAQWSRGIPRLVNSICDSALLLAFSQNKKRVEANEVLEVVRDLDLPAPPEVVPEVGTELEESLAAPAPVSKVAPVAEVKALSSNGNGNGHKPALASNGNPAAPLPASPASSPSPQSVKPITASRSEVVRAQAATRPRPSVFQRTERLGTGPSVAAWPSPSSPTTPGTVASGPVTPAPSANNGLRDPVHVRKLMRYDPEPPKRSRLAGWLAKLGFHSNRPSGDTLIPKFNSTGRRK